MKLEVFKEVVKRLEAKQEKERAGYKIGLDMYDLAEDLNVIISHLVGSQYGREGLDTFEWWCYDKDFGARADLQMTAADGSVLCSTIEELWSYLEAEANDSYDLPKKMTDEEKIESIKNFFG